jgi:hypothetical protein
LNINEIEHKYLQIILPKEENTITISGRVFDSGKRYVSGARVAFALSRYIFEKSPDTIPFAVFGLFSQQMTTTDDNGYCSLSILPSSSGILQISANGFELYREQMNSITQNVTKEIYLKTPQIFSIVVEDSAGRTVRGTTVTAEEAAIHRLGIEPDQYYATRYPFTTYAEGIEKNLGITERETVDNYQKDIILKLGSCTIQGQVTDDTGNPVKDLVVAVYSVGGKPNEPGWEVNKSAAFYSENGLFVLRNLVSGASSITVSAAGSKHLLLESTTLSLFLEDGVTTKITPVLKRR